MHTARRTHAFTESVIRGMTRLAAEHGAINLAQGFPNFPAPEVLKEAAAAAIRADINQYAITWGAKRLRDALARKYADWYGMTVEPGDARSRSPAAPPRRWPPTLLAIVDPGRRGDRVRAVLRELRPRRDPLRRASRSSCRSRPGSRSTSTGCAAAFSDADPRHHRQHAEQPDRAGCSPGPSSRRSPRSASGTTPGRSPTRSTSTSATRASTSRSRRCRGCASAPSPSAAPPRRSASPAGGSARSSRPPQVTDAIRKVHDFLTVGAPAPLQEARRGGARDAGPGLLRRHSRASTAPGATCCAARSVAAGFHCTPPRARTTSWPTSPRSPTCPTTEFAHWLTAEIGVAPVPGSSFFSRPELGRTLVRFAFCKTMEMLGEAARRLRAVKGKASRGRWRTVEGAGNRNSGRPAYIQYVC